VAGWLDVLVLCYHGVHPEARHGEVTPEALRRQLGFLSKQGYRFTTFTHAVCAGPAGKIAAVTFDDGIASAVEFGSPVLADLGAPGTMFPRLDTLDVAGRLDADGIARLAEGGWEIGSHTLRHPVLTLVDDERLHEELAGSKAAIERLVGHECTSVAYPEGCVDMRVVAAAAVAGYVAGAALEGGSTLAPGPLAWPRVGVRGDDGSQIFRLKCSRRIRRVRSGRLRRPVGYVAREAGRLQRRFRIEA
jgi:peptidoglycan/xylan/chitin deacetylase (PgdA/CDA1 family)